MRLSAVLLARVFAFVQVEDLNPRGAAAYPEIAKTLVERYGFLKYPQQPSEFDEEKGVVFECGKLNGHNIEKVIIYNNGIVLDTRSSTQDSESILEDALTWASKSLGLTYVPGMIKRRAYVSQLTFYFDYHLDGLREELYLISERISELVNSYTGQSLKYRTSAISFQYDPLTVKLTPAPFTIERRQDVPFSENKYFSVAPLPTDLHTELLTEFEKALHNN